MPVRRYVVLEHVFQGVHWDLMLELEGVLKTWSLDAWPLTSGVQTARQSADHRLVYLEYEGPISGDRGSVSRTEGGQFEIIAWEPDRIEIELIGGPAPRRIQLLRKLTGPNEGGLTGWDVGLIGNAD